MRKFTAITLVVLALLSACGKSGSELSGGDDTDPAAITISIAMSGNVGTDNVTATPATGKAGVEITLNFTLANTKLHNRLVFSGVNTPIAQVDSAGSGTRKYTVNAEDAAEDVITINAVFSHSELQLDTIAFENSSNITKTLGDAPFTRAVANRGNGAGAITYSSSDTSVATVNSVTGEVTILSVGTAEITATKASDGTYDQATAMYTLTVLNNIVVEVPKNYRNMFKEWGKTDAEITAKVNATWNKLFNGSATEKIYYEVAPDMAYILDSGNNDVRSEGMSYGMMMCVQLDKKTEFDRLWKWAKTYMYNPTTNAGGNNNRGYFAWQCNTNGTRKDQSPAPDGEFYFVTSLLFASARWGNGTGDLEYGKWARKILYDMVHRTPNNIVDPYSAPTMFDLTHKMPVFVPYGSSANHTDPSYHLPAFYEVWADELENDYDDGQLSGIWSSLTELKTDYEFYRAAAAASRAFFPTTVNATTGLGPDYANFNGTPTGGEHADFRYDAWRIAMNIAVDYAWWAKDPWQVTFADKIQAFFFSKGVTSYGSLWTLTGTLLSANNAGDHSPGLVACNAVASLAATHENKWKFIENLWNMPMTTGQYRYYDGCLYMLGLLHVSGNFKAYMSNTTPSASISPVTATFDKKAGAQADIPVTMTLNGNSFVSVKNGATTLTSGTNYTVSGNTVTIKKEYLAAQANGTTTLTFTFSAGKSRNIVITVKDTTGGGSGGGTLLKYDFANSATIANGYPKYSGSGISAAVTGGALRVEKTTTSSTLSFVLPFTVGDGGNISNYSGIKVNLRGVSGDYTYKDFKAWAGTTTGTELGSVASSLNTTFKDITVPLSGSLAANSEGIIEIGFGFPNANAFVYEIKSIELVPK